MGSTTIRRFGLVVAIVLLAPGWSQTSVVARAVRTRESLFVALAPAGTAPTPAIRRHTSAGWWVHGSKPDPSGRDTLALAVVALLSLLGLVPWARQEAVRSAPSALTRRRHGIALRAPPLLRCA